jgi:hypothetical protein
LIKIHFFFFKKKAKERFFFDISFEYGSNSTTSIKIINGGKRIAKSKIPQTNVSKGSLKRNEMLSRFNGR